MLGLWEHPSAANSRHKPGAVATQPLRFTPSCIEELFFSIIWRCTGGLLPLFKMEGAGGGEGSTGAVTGQQALHVEHAVPVNKLLLTVGYVTGVVSGIGFIVSLTVAPMAALGSLATSAASLVLLQLAAPKRSPHAVGPSRWMGAAAAAHVTALVWSLVILNALGAMRYYSGVETVAWFQFGMVSLLSCINLSVPAR